MADYKVIGNVTIGNIQYADSLETALSNADICMIQSERDEFKKTDYDKDIELIVDGRRTLKNGIKNPYFSIGSGKR